MRRAKILLCLSLSVPAILRAQDGAAIAAAARSITPADIIQRIRVIAADSMRGRYTPSPELEQVAAFIAGQFRRSGLRPAGDNGTFLQRYTVDRVHVDTGSARVAVHGGPTWRVGRDAVFEATSGLPAAPISGPVLVVAGPGPRGSALAGLRGRVIVAVPPVTAAGLPTPQGSQMLSLLLRSGAAAVIAVAPVRDTIWQRLRQAEFRPVMRFPWDEPEPPLLTIRDEAMAPVLAAHGVNLTPLHRATQFQATSLPDLSFTIELSRKVVQSFTAPNVVGMLEGSDPTLKNEYLVFSAHMDHVGVGRPDLHGDSIYNGADDDASGTAAVMELAEAFTRLTPRPKRSLIFLTVSGEERGLWGSSYFTAFPPVPMDRMVADLNQDMVGRNWKDTIVAIGRKQSDLGTTLGRVNAAHPELGMTAIDDLWPEERFYFRSDHYNFARRGVPILFFFNGVHEDYHQPGDEPAKIDAEKEARIVRLVFYLGLEIANAAQRPQWDPASYREVVGSR